MLRLTPSLKVKVIRLHKKGKRNYEILGILKEQDEITFSWRHLTVFIKRENQMGFLISPRSKPHQSIHNRPEILDFIDRKLEGNYEITAPDLVKMLAQKLTIDIFESTVKRLRRKLGWLSTGSKYCQLIKEQNQPKRLDYCQCCLDTSETFDDLIFTDECAVDMESHAKLSFHRWWEPPRLKGCPKHPYKVHVWGAILRRPIQSLSLLEFIQITIDLCRTMIFIIRANVLVNITTQQASIGGAHHQRALT